MKVYLKIHDDPSWTENKLLWTKNIFKFVKLPSYKILYPNAHRKDLYLIWAGSDSTERQLKQQVTASLAKYVELFCSACNEIIEDKKCYSHVNK